MTKQASLGALSLFDGLAEKLSKRSVKSAYWQQEEQSLRKKEKRAKQRKKSIHMELTKYHTTFSL